MIDIRSVLAARRGSARQCAPLLAALALASSLIAAEPTTTSAPANFPEERTLTFHMDEGLRVHVNRPPEGAEPAKRLIIYALPNGNTIEQTVGCRTKEGLDWHFYIQHIGAQTRRLRELCTEQPIAIAYVEADGRSWPGWKTRHPNYGELVPKIISRVAYEAGGPFASIMLCAHSGGGSLIFSIIESRPKIAEKIERIAFLDANYNYSNEARHGDKLIEWLNASHRHVLSVICYDDSKITLNGKPVLSAPDRGTWGATQRMIERFGQDMKFDQSTSGDIITLTGLSGRVEFIRHTNPANKILHTVLVGEMSGFLHAMTFSSSCEKEAGVFGGPVTYDKWIQAEPLVLTPASTSLLASRPSSRPASRPASQPTSRKAGK